MVSTRPARNRTLVPPGLSSVDFLQPTQSHWRHRENRVWLEPEPAVGGLDQFRRVSNSRIDVLGSLGTAPVRPSASVPGSAGLAGVYMAVLCSVVVVALVAGMAYALSGTPEPASFRSLGSISVESP